MQIATTYKRVHGIRSCLAVILAVTLALSFSSWAFAEEATESDSTTETVAVEQSVPTQESVAPQISETPPPLDAPIIRQPETQVDAAPEPSVAPEPEKQEVPETPDQQVIDAPFIPEPVETEPAEPETSATEEQQPTENESPVTKEPLPTETPTPTATLTPSPEPTATPSPTPEPSPTPSPSPEPIPVVTWSQTEQVSCTLNDGQSAGLKFSESRTYRCEVSANVSSDLEMPEDMEIEWTVDVEFPDRYAMQFPQGSQASIKGQVSASSTGTKYTIAPPWQQGSDQKLTFDLVVTRNTCAVGEQVLSVQANPKIHTRTSEAEIVRSGGVPIHASYESEFLPNLETPDVSMTQVDFGTLEWDGESWGTATGTSTVTVANAEPCATSQPHLIHLQIDSSDPSMQPVLISVDTEQNRFISAEVNDKEIVIIQPGFDGSADIELEFELTPPEDVFEGDYTFGFEVTVNSVP